MSKLLDLPVGTFLRIPLDDGSFGYGRVVNDHCMAFYHHRTTEPSSDLDVIESRPVIFKQSVRLFDTDSWVTLGVRPLQGEVAQPMVAFRQRLGDYRYCIIWDSTKGSRRATPEECIGLERASVWDAPHIQERLLDTFMGRPNPIEVRARVVFED